MWAGRAWQVVAIAVLASCGGGCAPKPVVSPAAAAFDALPAGTEMLVCPAIVVGTASPGNAGRDFVTIERQVTERTLSAVRDRFTNARLAGSDCAATASRDSAYALIPAITEWTEMRTDDPLGALLLPHNSVTIALRLLHGQPLSVVREVTFHHRARFTSNKKAIGLVDGGYRRTVLHLLGA